MRPTKEIERCLAYIPPGLRDVVLELRNIIQAAAPTVTEEIQRQGFTYYYKERGGPVSAGVCQIGLSSQAIRLAFIHGAFLPDPEGLLRGREKYKRYIELDSYEQAPWEALAELIKASARFDPREIASQRRAS
jgi:hypothetical protein